MPSKMTKHAERITRVTSAHPELEINTVRKLLVSKYLLATKDTDSDHKDLNPIMEEFTEMLIKSDDQQIEALAGWTWELEPGNNFRAT